jgi:hypothetical protein
MDSITDGNQKLVLQKKAAHPPVVDVLDHTEYCKSQVLVWF